MPRLIWSPGALRDVQRLRRFLADKHIDAAKRAVAAIRQSTRVLGQQPGVGRPAQGIDPGYCEWLVDFGDSGYIVRYHYDGATAVILAVRPQREVGY